MNLGRTRKRLGAATRSRPTALSFPRLLLAALCARSIAPSPHRIADHEWRGSLQWRRDGSVSRDWSGSRILGGDRRDVAGWSTDARTGRPGHARVRSGTAQDTWKRVEREAQRKGRCVRVMCAHSERAKFISPRDDERHSPSLPSLLFCRVLTAEFQCNPVRSGEDWPQSAGVRCAVSLPFLRRHLDAEPQECTVRRRGGQHPRAAC